MAETKVTATELLNGIIYRRQGGDATKWSTAGSTNYDVSANQVKVQVGVSNNTGVDTSVTFPIAYTAIPIVIAQVQGEANIASNNSVAVVSTTTTGFVTRTEPTTNQANPIAWIAIGV